MLIVGGDEADNGTVAVRKQGEGDVGGMTTAAFADPSTVKSGKCWVATR